MPSLIPIGGAVRVNPSAGGAATVVPLAEGGFAAIYRVANGPDVFTLYDDNSQPLTGEIVVTSDDFLAPQAAPLNDGRFVVAWLAQDQTIQAAIYNPDGSLSAGGIALASPTDPAVGLSAPKIVGNAFGGFTAIWQDNATINGVAGTVFIQSYDGDGNLVGDPITVEPPAENGPNIATISDFRMAVLGDGTIVVAAQVQINGVDSIMYSVNGGTLRSLAGGDANYIYTNPQIAPLAAGGYVITYDFVNPNLVGSDSPDANWTTGGSVFTSQGTRHDFAIGTTVTTTENGTFSVDPSVITPLADGGFVVTFEPLTSPLGDGYLVDAQQFDAFGNAVGPVVLVAPQGFLPSVATSADGVVLDTFQFGTGVFLQGFNSAPTPLGLEPIGTSFGLDSVVSANSPGVAALSRGGFVVVFQDANGASWAQIYGFDRQPIGAAYEVAAHGAQPVVAAQANGTFLVAWSTGSQIMGALYDNQGDLLNGPFSMSGDPASLPLVAPALNATTSGGYTLAYETDLQDGTGSHEVTIQVFDGEGNAIGSPASQTFQPTNPLAPPKIAGLERQLFGSVTVIGVGDSIFAAFVSPPPTGNSSAGIAGQPIVTSHAGTQIVPNTIQVSGGGDGAARAGSQVTTIADGNVVVVWNEAAANAETWQVMGQVMTSAGVFVGSRFSINTALPSSSPAAAIALSALPDGGFLVTYNSGNGTLASERFDQNGGAMGGPVLMSGYGQAGAVTTVLSDGSVLLLSGSNSTGGGTVTGATFSVPILPMNWTGATSTNLATAGNWDLQIAPDTGHAMQFGLANGATLTGTATAQSAVFTGAGHWALSGASVGLAQGLTVQSSVTVAGGTVTAGGAASIGVAGDAILAASGAAHLSFLSTAVGTNAGETGDLTLSGAGTTWTDTGTGGAGGLRAGASAGAQPGRGVVAVTQGAVLTGSDTDVLGVTAGSEGDLSIAGGGGVTDAAMVVGAAGMGTITVNDGTLASASSVTVGQSAGGQGVLTVSGTGAAVVDSGTLIAGAAGIGAVTIENQGTVRVGGTAVAAPGIDLGQTAGGSGTIQVLGTNALLNNTGRFIVGDSGLGFLAIASGGTVVTNPGTLAGLIVSNTTAAAGSSVNVTGTGSNLIVTGPLDVGVGGSGGLQISGGATVSAASLDAGNVAAAVGQIGISGTGSALLITNDATVADDGTGVMSVLSGATFAATSLTIGNTGNSSGALVVSGAGSVVNLSSTLNIGTSLGTGDLTVGPGGAVHAAVLNLQGQVVLEGGLLDPTVSVINQGQTAGGFGTLAAGAIVDEGVIQAGGSKPSQKLLLVQGTVLGGGTLSKNGTVQPSVAAGILQINAGGTMELTGAVLNTSTTFNDVLTPTGTYSVTNSVIDVTFSDGAGVLLLDDIAGFAGTITAFKAGDQFVVTGGTLSNVGVTNGNTLTFADSGVNAGVGGVDQIIFGSPISAGQFNIANGNTVQTVACFAAGTMIATTRGHVPVQNVHPGDQVCTVLGGDTAEVIWVGRRTVDCARHPDPTKVWPIRVLSNAFGHGMPSTDLILSPDHAVYVDDVLIPIRLLVNGRTIRQELADRITYHHIELARHDVLLANGMPAESYLDTGDKNRFSSGRVVALHPDFSARSWETKGCAPLVQTGPTLTSVRRRVAADLARRKRRTRETFLPGNNWPG